MFLTVKQRLTHIYLVRFLVTGRVMLEIYYPCMLSARIVWREIVVGLKPQVMRITCWDLRSCHLKVKVNKTFSSFIHMINGEENLR